MEDTQYKKMYNRFCKLLLVMAAGLLLVACRVNSSDRTNLKGHILVWSWWDEAEAEVLDELFAQFMVIYPEVEIIHSTITPLQVLGDEYWRQARLGLGPDLLIGASSWIPNLANDSLLQDLSDRNIDTSAYLSTAIETLRFQDGLYGLPFSLHTFALYYNKKLVSTPPKTLDELLIQAADGKQVALDTSFYEAAWGIQAFGGQIFDDEGRLVLNQGGFANWLNWLKNAQTVPGIILDNDEDTLYALFQAGETAYYVGGPDRLRELQEILGKDMVGVTPLPVGPNNASGPFLQAEALMFNAASSLEQTELALRLAQFLTSEEQQRKLVTRQVGRIPANAQVRVNPRLYPALASFVAQTKTAIPVPNIPQVRDIIVSGDNIYVQVLEGVIGASEAAHQLTERVNAKYGFEPVSVTSGTTCDLEGTIQVWHRWSEAEATVLNKIADNFVARCPGVLIVLVRSEPDELYNRYQNTFALEQGPDLLIGPSEWIAPLATEGMIYDLSRLVESALLQQYLPATQEIIRYQGKLYALPESLELMALYYKADLVNDPPRLVEDLLNQAAPDRQLALPTDYYHAFWGLMAFGGMKFDDQYRPLIDQGGVVRWLRWLLAAQNNPNIILSNDLALLRAAFVEGEAAYFAGEASQLGDLQAALGEERVRVVSLPSGPEKAGTPFVTVEGLMLNSASSQEQAKLTLEFAKYMTGVESQMLLMEQAGHIPTNANVQVAKAAYPAVAGFFEQAKIAIPLSSELGVDFFWDLGDALYTEVLARAGDPVELVDGFVQIANLTSVSEAVVTVVPTGCEGRGQVLLWHSWPEVAAMALAEIIAAFADVCPDIVVEAQFVPADDFLAQLAEAKASAGPDFFLASHDLVLPLKRDNLIKAVTTLIDQSVLGQLYPETVSALRSGSDLYGLPQTFKTMALYYNTDLVDKPPRTLDDLLSAATPATPVALDTSFYGAFWGVSTFGGRLVDDEGQLVLSEGGLEAWLDWLQKARTKPGFMFSPDRAELEALFAAGEVAYLVTESDALYALRAALGEEKVGLAPLPAGPLGKASSFVRVEGFLFSAAARREQTELALAFAEFAVSPANQTLLMEEADRPPTSLGVNIFADAAMATFAELGAGGTGSPPADMSLLELGDKVYTEVLNEGLDPARAVDELMKAVTNTAE